VLRRSAATHHPVRVNPHRMRCLSAQQARTGAVLASILAVVLSIVLAILAVVASVVPPAASVVPPVFAASASPA